ncbi:MAG: hypothetical protein ACW97Z_14995 [Candidatus Hodarchaeales archaeon]|jgi:hypothetical protein
MSKIVDVKFIRLGYLIGGIYDLFLGLGVILIPDLLISFFQITKPNNMIFVYTSGLFLLVVSYYLLYACFHELTNFLFIGFGSSMVRFVFAIIVVLLWITEGIEFAYILIALTDSITGLMIIIPIILTKGLTREDLWINY